MSIHIFAESTACILAARHGASFSLSVIYYLVNSRVKKNTGWTVFQSYSIVVDKDKDTYIYVVWFKKHTRTRRQNVEQKDQSYQANALKNSKTAVCLFPL